MNRKDTNGGTMFKFSLWSNASKVRPGSFPPSSRTGEANIIGAEPKVDLQTDSRLVNSDGRTTLRSIADSKTPDEAIEAADSNSTPNSAPTQAVPARIVSEGSRFVSKFNQDVSKYALPSPEPTAEEPSFQDAPSDANVKNVTTVASSVPSKFRTLVA